MKEQNKRVKVLQVVPLGTGGVTSLVLNIAESIDKAALCVRHCGHASGAGRQNADPLAH